MGWTAFCFFRVEEGDVDIQEIAQINNRRWLDSLLVQSAPS
jgi:hypothetical protein